MHARTSLLLELLSCVATISSTYSSGVATLTANNSSNGVAVRQQPIFELARSPFACTRLWSSAPHLSNWSRLTRGLHPYMISVSGSAWLPAKSTSVLLGPCFVIRVMDHNLCFEMHKEAGITSFRGGSFRNHRGTPSYTAYVSSVMMEFGPDGMS